MKSSPSKQLPSLRNKDIDLSEYDLLIDMGTISNITQLNKSNRKLKKLLYNERSKSLNITTNQISLSFQKEDVNKEIKSWVTGFASKCTDDSNDVNISESFLTNPNDLSESLTNYKEYNNLQNSNNNHLVDNNKVFNRSRNNRYLKSNKQIFKKKLPKIEVNKSVESKNVNVTIDYIPQSPMTDDCVFSPSTGKYAHKKLNKFQRNELHLTTAKFGLPSNCINNKVINRNKKSNYVINLANKYKMFQPYYKRLSSDYLDSSLFKSIISIEEKLTDISLDLVNISTDKSSFSRNDDDTTIDRSNCNSPFMLLTNRSCGSSEKRELDYWMNTVNNNAETDLELSSITNKNVVESENSFKIPDVSSSTSNNTSVKLDVNIVHNLESSSITDSKIDTMSLSTVGSLFTLNSKKS
mmetsp:Transcript_22967/g.20863  ORF Transcript_22967/g.20863 Transcript_22967/m.20863 type:complete len:410 (+) Transcript_22967:74-1303(+)